MSSKSKGTNAERELIKLFHTNSWAPVRVAGSGSAPIPSPDILASNGARQIALECKYTTSGSIYIKDEEIEQLRTFCLAFGAEPWIAIRFVRKQWLFLRPEEMEKKGKSYCATIKQCGRTFRDLIEEES